VIQMGVMKITVDETGTINVDADGYVGDTCLKELKALQEGLEKLGVTNDLASQEMKRQTVRATTRTTRRA